MAGSGSPAPGELPASTPAAVAPNGRGASLLLAVAASWLRDVPRAVQPSVADRPLVELCRRAPGRGRRGWRRRACAALRAPRVTIRPSPGRRDARARRRRALRRAGRSRAACPPAGLRAPRWPARRTRGSSARGTWPRTSRWRSPARPGSSGSAARLRRLPAALACAVGGGVYARPFPPVPGPRRSTPPGPPAAFPVLVRRRRLRLRHPSHRRWRSRRRASRLGAAWCPCGSRPARSARCLKWAGRRPSAGGAGGRCRGAASRRRS